MKAFKSLVYLLLFLCTTLLSMMLLSSQPMLADSLSFANSIKLTSVNHIGIPVRNLDRSLKFYRDLTGGTVLFADHPMYGEGLSKGTKVANASLRFGMLKVDNTILELIEYENPRGKDFDRLNNDIGSIHIAFEVPNIQAVYEQLKAQGVEFNAPPYTFTEEDGAPDIVGATFAYFKDPDGIQLEIFEPAKSKSL
ncbi:MAG: VOC family protein [Xenococcaceae cyanobacterium]